jgi:endonuclease/exonuclease/phosphatase family metal-dependent hydrolase
MFFTVVLAALAGCDTFVDNTTNVAPQELTQLSFLTLNTGLDAEGVLNYAERKKEIPTAVYESGADVICLQEVWKEADEKWIADQLKLVFPYRYYKVTKGTDTEPQPAACTEEDLTPMAMCYLTNCSETDATDVVAIGLCLAQNCLTEITGIPTECRDCLIGAITGGATDITGIMAECTAEQVPVEMAQGGNNGLMLLSKYQLIGAKLGEFDSFYYKRGYISAKIQHPILGAADIVCTQLTDAVAGMPYEGALGSWEGELTAQAQAIIDLAPLKDTDFRVLMGDLAAGPAIGRDIRGKNPSVYEMFYYAYYYDPFIENQNAEPLCTLCGDNPLTAAETVDQISSHILFTDYEALPLTAERVFDEGFIVTDKTGKEKTYQYSDHYGIKTTLSRGSDN